MGRTQVMSGLTNALAIGVKVEGQGKGHGVQGLVGNNIGNAGVLSTIWMNIRFLWPPICGYSNRVPVSRCWDGRFQRYRHAEIQLL